MILDTSVLIDVLRGEPAVVERERELDERGTAIVSTVSVMELWEGIQRADASESERERVAALLEGLRHADFDHDAAVVAGDIAATLTARGEMIDIEDVMIGAVALTRDQAVLTRNADHFARIDGLAVVVRGYLSMVSELVGDQWNEGDVSCSVVRRVALPASLAIGDTLDLQEHYLPILVDLTTAQAYAENTDAASKQVAATYSQRALQQLGSVSQGAARVPPAVKEDAT
jgi:predicted nucleic acid-binding protein